MKWFSSNKLSLSLGKSKFIVFHGKRKNSVPHLNKIIIDGEEICRAQNLKYIGLILDENVTWEPHINSIIKSLQPYFGVFYNIRSFINLPTARSIYFSTIYSRIKYGIEIYGSATKRLTNKLQVMQNKLLKVLLNKNRRYSTNALHSYVNILNVDDICNSALLNFVYDCIAEDPIDSFTDFFALRQNFHPYNTRQHHDIQQRRPNTQYGKSTTHYKGSDLWNN